MAAIDIHLMQFAVEAAARCAGLGQCADQASTIAYANARAGIPGATFTANLADTCGASVAGSYNFNLITMFDPVAINVSACYPKGP